MHWLRIIRIKVLELSQTDLADAVDTNQIAVSRWEQSGGKMSMDRDAFLNLQELFGEKIGAGMPVIWYLTEPTRSDVEGWIGRLKLQAVSDGRGDLSDRLQLAFTEIVRADNDLIGCAVRAAG